MTNKETFARDDESTDLKSERIIIDIWQPLWSNLAFLGVVLAYTCFYISRRDFYSDPTPFGRFSSRRAG
jgi:sugar phosphate permease